MTCLRPILGDFPLADWAMFASVHGDVNRVLSGDWQSIYEALTS